MRWATIHGVVGSLVKSTVAVSLGFLQTRSVSSRRGTCWSNNFPNGAELVGSIRDSGVRRNP